MPHFGLICPPGPSHVTGLTTIARELFRRGHRATVFNIADVEELARKEGVEFRLLGAEKHPKGSFATFSKQFSQLHGTAALRFGLKVALEEIAMLLEDAPEAMRAAGVTALCVDQGQPAGSTLAERLNVPFITICNATPLELDSRVPPPFLSRGPATSWTNRLGNYAAYRMSDIAAFPLRRKINSYRRAWGMKPLGSLYDTFSPVLRLAQQTADFDFPRSLPPEFHYIGLIRRASHQRVEFPFERLDGRPLVYASLGTVRTDNHGLFRMLAEICTKLNVQLVITLGGTGSPEGCANLPGSPIVVSYAPQLAILERAALTVCHAGTNTVLESLAHGVPVIAMPLNTDQYGVAARLQHSGAGERIDLRRLSVEQLDGLVRRVLSEPSYRERACVVGNSLKRAGGERRAADLIEERIGKA